MGEAVQHPLAGAEALHCQPVVFLVQEKAGLLSILYIHHVLDPVFHDLYLRVKGVSDKALVPLHAFLEADLGVAALVDAPDGDAVLRQHFFQLFQDHRLPAVDS